MRFKSCFRFSLSTGSYLQKVSIKQSTLCFVLFLSLIAMASNRNEIFHFLLFCHFGFLQTSLCSSASHLWHQARFPIFTVCFLAQLSGISWKGALFCVVYCVEFWKYFDLHLSILSLCVSSLARQFCFCFCLFSLWWILR